MKTCHFCNKPVEDYLNYCSWDCQVTEAKAAGGQEIRPNGLPVACIRADGTMMEHEHADHPSYKFPVEVAYCGPEPPADLDEISKACDFGSQSHALIFSDGAIALTLYECCYAMWRLSDGSFMGAASVLWKKGEWKLTPEALAEIHDR